MSFLQKIMGKNSKKDKSKGRKMVPEKGLKGAAALASSAAPPSPASATTPQVAAQPSLKPEAQASIVAAAAAAAAAVAAPPATTTQLDPPPPKLKGKKSRGRPSASTSQVNDNMCSQNPKESNQALVSSLVQDGTTVKVENQETVILNTKMSISESSCSTLTEVPEKSSSLNESEVTLPIEISAFKIPPSNSEEKKGVECHIDFSQKSKEVPASTKSKPERVSKPTQQSIVSQQGKEEKPNDFQVAEKLKALQTTESRGLHKQSTHATQTAAPIRLETKCLEVERVTESSTHISSWLHDKLALETQFVAMSLDAALSSPSPRETLKTQAGGSNAREESFREVGIEYKEPSNVSYPREGIPPQTSGSCYGMIKAETPVETSEDIIPSCLGPVIVQRRMEESEPLDVSKQSNAGCAASKRVSDTLWTILETFEQQIHQDKTSQKILGNIPKQKENVEDDHKTRRKQTENVDSASAPSTTIQLTHEVDGIWMIKTEKQLHESLGTGVVIEHEHKNKTYQVSVEPTVQTKVFDTHDDLKNKGNKTQHTDEGKAIPLHTNQPTTPSSSANPQENASPFKENDPKTLNDDHEPEVAIAAVEPQQEHQHINLLQVPENRLIEEKLTSELDEQQTIVRGLKFANVVDSHHESLQERQKLDILRESSEKEPQKDKDERPTEEIVEQANLTEELNNVTVANQTQNEILRSEQEVICYDMDENKPWQLRKEVEKAIPTEATVDKTRNENLVSEQEVSPNDMDEIISRIPCQPERALENVIPTTLSAISPKTIIQEQTPTRAFEPKDLQVILPTNVCPLADDKFQELDTPNSQEVDLQKPRKVSKLLSPEKDNPEAQCTVTEAPTIAEEKYKPLDGEPSHRKQLAVAAEAIGIQEVYQVVESGQIEEQVSTQVLKQEELQHVHLQLDNESDTKSMSIEGLQGRIQQGPEKTSNIKEKPSHDHNHECSTTPATVELKVHEEQVSDNSVCEVNTTVIPDQITQKQECDSQAPPHSITRGSVVDKHTAQDAVEPDGLVIIPQHQHNGPLQLDIMDALVQGGVAQDPQAENLEPTPWSSRMHSEQCQESIHKELTPHTVNGQNFELEEPNNNNRKTVIDQGKNGDQELNLPTKHTETTIDSQEMMPLGPVTIADEDHQCAHMELENKFVSLDGAEGEFEVQNAEVIKPSSEQTSQEIRFEELEQSLMRQQSVPQIDDKKPEQAQKPEHRNLQDIPCETEQYSMSTDEVPVDVNFHEIEQEIKQRPEEINLEQEPFTHECNQSTWPTDNVEDVADKLADTNVKLDVIEHMNRFMESEAASKPEESVNENPLPEIRMFSESDTLCSKPIQIADIQVAISTSAVNTSIDAIVQENQEHPEIDIGQVSPDTETPEEVIRDKDMQKIEVEEPEVAHVSQGMEQEVLDAQQEKMCAQKISYSNDKQQTIVVDEHNLAVIELDKLQDIELDPVNTGESKEVQPHTENPAGESLSFQLTNHDMIATDADRKVSTEVTIMEQEHASLYIAEDDPQKPEVTEIAVDKKQDHGDRFEQDCAEFIIKEPAITDASAQVGKDWDLEVTKITHPENVGQEIQVRFLSTIEGRHNEEAMELEETEIQQAPWNSKLHSEQEVALVDSMDKLIDSMDKQEQKIEDLNEIAIQRTADQVQLVYQHTKQPVNDEDTMHSMDESKTESPTVYHTDTSCITEEKQACLDVNECKSKEQEPQTADAAIEKKPASEGICISQAPEEGDGEDLSSETDEQREPLCEPGVAEVQIGVVNDQEQELQMTNAAVEKEPTNDRIQIMKAPQDFDIREEVSSNIHEHREAIVEHEVTAVHAGEVNEYRLDEKELQMTNTDVEKDISIRQEVSLGIDEQKEAICKLQLVEVQIGDVTEHKLKEQVPPQTDTAVRTMPAPEYITITDEASFETNVQREAICESEIAEVQIGGVNECMPNKLELQMTDAAAEKEATSDRLEITQAPDGIDITEEVSFKVDKHREAICEPAIAQVQMGDVKGYKSKELALQMQDAAVEKEATSDEIEIIQAPQDTNMKEEILSKADKQREAVCEPDAAEVQIADVSMNQLRVEMDGFQQPEELTAELQPDNGLECGQGQNTSALDNKPLAQKNKQEIGSKELHETDVQDEPDAKISEGDQRTNVCELQVQNKHESCTPAKADIFEKEEDHSHPDIHQLKDVSDEPKLTERKQECSQFISSDDQEHALDNLDEQNNDIQKLEGTVPHLKDEGQNFEMIDKSDENMHEQATEHEKTTYDLEQIENSTHRTQLSLVQDAESKIGDLKDDAAAVTTVTESSPLLAETILLHSVVEDQAFLDQNNNAQGLEVTNILFPSVVESQGLDVRCSSVPEQSATQGSDESVSTEQSTKEQQFPQTLTVPAQEKQMSSDLDAHNNQLQIAEETKEQVENPEARDMGQEQTSSVVGNKPENVEQFDKQATTDKTVDVANESSDICNLEMADVSSHSDHEGQELNATNLSKQENCEETNLWNKEPRCDQTIIPPTEEKLVSGTVNIPNNELEEVQPIKAQVEISQTNSRDDQKNGDHDTEADIICNSSLLVEDIDHEKHAQALLCTEELQTSQSVGECRDQVQEPEQINEAGMESNTLDEHEETETEEEQSVQHIQCKQNTSAINEQLYSTERDSGEMHAGAQDNNEMQCEALAIELEGKATSTVCSILPCDDVSLNMREKSVEESFHLKAEDAAIGLEECHDEANKTNRTHGIVESKQKCQEIEIQTSQSVEKCNDQVQNPEQINEAGMESKTLYEDEKIQTEEEQPIQHPKCKQNTRAMNEKLYSIEKENEEMHASAQDNICQDEMECEALSIELEGKVPSRVCDILPRDDVPRDDVALNMSQKSVEETFHVKAEDAVIGLEGCQDEANETNQTHGIVESRQEYQEKEPNQANTAPIINKQATNKIEQESCTQKAEEVSQQQEETLQRIDQTTLFTQEGDQKHEMQEKQMFDAVVSNTRIVDGENPLRMDNQEIDSGELMSNEVDQQQYAIEELEQNKNQTETSCKSFVPEEKAYHSLDTAPTKADNNAQSKKATFAEDVLTCDQSAQERSHSSGEILIESDDKAPVEVPRCAQEARTSQERVIIGSASEQKQNTGTDRKYTESFLEEQGLEVTNAEMEKAETQEHQTPTDSLRSQQEVQKCEEVHVNEQKAKVRHLDVNTDFSQVKDKLPLDTLTDETERGRILIEAMIPPESCDKDPQLPHDKKEATKQTQERNEVQYDKLFTVDEQVTTPNKEMEGTQESELTGAPFDEVSTVEVTPLNHDRDGTEESEIKGAPLKAYKEGFKDATQKPNDKAEAAEKNRGDEVSPNEVEEEQVLTLNENRDDTQENEKTGAPLAADKDQLEDARQEPNAEEETTEQYQEIDEMSSDKVFTEPKVEEGGLTLSEERDSTPESQGTGAPFEEDKNGFKDAAQEPHDEEKTTEKNEERDEMPYVEAVTESGVEEQVQNLNKERDGTQQSEITGASIETDKDRYKNAEQKPHHKEAATEKNPERNEVPSDEAFTEPNVEEQVQTLNEERDCTQQNAITGAPHDRDKDGFEDTAQEPHDKEEVSEQNQETDDVPYDKVLTEPEVEVHVIPLNEEKDDAPISEITRAPLEADKDGFKDATQESNDKEGTRAPLEADKDGFRHATHESNDKEDETEQSQERDEVPSDEVFTEPKVEEQVTSVNKEKDGTNETEKTGCEEAPVNEQEERVQHIEVNPDQPESVTEDKATCDTITNEVESSRVLIKAIIPPEDEHISSDQDRFKDAAQEPNGKEDATEQNQGRDDVQSDEAFTGTKTEEQVTTLNEERDATQETEKTRAPFEADKESLSVTEAEQTSETGKIGETCSNPSELSGSSQEEKNISTGDTHMLRQLVEDNGFENKEEALKAVNKTVEVKEENHEEEIRDDPVAAKHEKQTLVQVTAEGHAESQLKAHSTESETDQLATADENCLSKDAEECKHSTLEEDSGRKQEKDFGLSNLSEYSSSANSIKARTVVAEEPAGATVCNKQLESEIGEPREEGVGIEKENECQEEKCEQVHIGDVHAEDTLYVVRKHQNDIEQLEVVSQSETQTEDMHKMEVASIAPGQTNDAIKVVATESDVDSIKRNDTDVLTGQVEKTDSIEADVKRDGIAKRDDTEELKEEEENLKLEATNSIGVDNNRVKKRDDIEELEGPDKTLQVEAANSIQEDNVNWSGSEELKGAEDTNKLEASNSMEVDIEKDDREEQDDTEYLKGPEKTLQLEAAGSIEVDRERDTERKDSTEELQGAEVALRITSTEMEIERGDTKELKRQEKTLQIEAADSPEVNIESNDTRKSDGTENLQEAEEILKLETTDVDTEREDLQEEILKLETTEVDIEREDTEESDDTVDCKGQEKTLQLEAAGSIEVDIERDDTERKDSKEDLQGAELALRITSTEMKIEREDAEGLKRPEKTLQLEASDSPQVDIESDDTKKSDGTENLQEAEEILQLETTAVDTERKVAENLQEEILKLETTEVDIEREDTEESDDTVERKGQDKTLQLEAANLIDVDKKRDDTRKRDGKEESKGVEETHKLRATDSIKENIEMHDMQDLKGADEETEQKPAILGDGQEHPTYADEQKNKLHQIDMASVPLDGVELELEVTDATLDATGQFDELKTLDGKEEHPKTDDKEPLCEKNNTTAVNEVVSIETIPQTDTDTPLDGDKQSNELKDLKGKNVKPEQIEPELKCEENHTMPGDKEVSQTNVGSETQNEQQLQVTNQSLDITCGMPKLELGDLLVEVTQNKDAEQELIKTDESMNAKMKIECEQRNTIVEEPGLSIEGDDQKHDLQVLKKATITAKSPEMVPTIEEDQIATEKEQQVQLTELPVVLNQESWEIEPDQDLITVTCQQKAEHKQDPGKQQDLELTDVLLTSGHGKLERESDQVFGHRCDLACEQPITALEPKEVLAPSTQEKEYSASLQKEIKDLKAEGIRTSINAQSDELQKFSLTNIGPTELQTKESILEDEEQGHKDISSTEVCTETPCPVDGPEVPLEIKQYKQEQHNPVDSAVQQQESTVKDEEKDDVQEVALTTKEHLYSTVLLKDTDMQNLQFQEPNHETSLRDTHLSQEPACQKITLPVHEERSYTHAQEEPGVDLDIKSEHQMSCIKQEDNRVTCTDIGKASDVSEIIQINEQNAQNLDKDFDERRDIYGNTSNVLLKELAPTKDDKAHNMQVMLEALSELKQQVLETTHAPTAEQQDTVEMHNEPVKDEPPQSSAAESEKSSIICLHGIDAGVATSMQESTCVTKTKSEIEILKEAHAAFEETPKHEEPTIVVESEDSRVVHQEEQTQYSELPVAGPNEQNFMLAATRMDVVAIEPPLSTCIDEQDNEVEERTVYIIHPENNSDNSHHNPDQMPRQPGVKNYEERLENAREDPTPLNIVQDEVEPQVQNMTMKAQQDSYKMKSTVLSAGNATLLDRQMDEVDAAKQDLEETPGDSSPDGEQSTNEGGHQQQEVDEACQSLPQAAKPTTCLITEQFSPSCSIEDIEQTLGNNQSETQNEMSIDVAVQVDRQNYELESECVPTTCLYPKQPTNERNDGVLVTKAAGAIIKCTIEQENQDKVGNRFLADEQHGLEATKTAEIAKNFAPRSSTH